MTDEIENIEEIESPEVEITEETQEISLEAVKSGEVEFRKLPKEDKLRITREARENLEDEQDKEAWDMGWRSPEFFAGKNRDGSDRDFIDSKAFLEKIEQNAPVQNERLKTLREREAQKDREMDELRAEVRKANEIAKMNFERSLKGEEQSIEARLQEARDLGDFDTYDSLLIEKSEIAKGKARLQEYEPEEPKAPVQTEVQPEVKEWGARNQWFYTNESMKSFAIAQEDVLRSSRPDLNLSQRLEIITKQARVTFPDSFPNESARPAVLTSRKSGSLSLNKKEQAGFSTLPEGEKKQAYQMIKQGVFKNESDFMKSYNSII